MTPDTLAPASQAHHFLALRRFDRSGNVQYARLGPLTLEDTTDRNLAYRFVNRTEVEHILNIQGTSDWRAKVVEVLVLLDHPLPIHIRNA